MAESASAALPAQSERMGDPLLARAYQTQRLHGSLLTVAWNLTWLAAFLRLGLADRQPRWIPAALCGESSWVAYVGVFFALYALLNLPLEVWYGYWLDRRWGLLKQGLRAWARDWLIGVLQHGMMFTVGGMLIVWCQRLAGGAWLVWAAASLLILFFLNIWLGAYLLPGHLFEFQEAEENLRLRLSSLVGPRCGDLPRVVVYAHPELRDFAGGMVGVGRRQILLISRPTVALGSDTLLRFVLLHEMGHRRHHHQAWATVLGWAWVVLAMVVCDAWIRRTAPMVGGTPMYIPWLAMGLTTWMVLGQPLVAYVGRRLEYQADRFFLEQGGSIDEMRCALEELSRWDLARTDLILPRQSLVQAMPTPARRLHKAMMLAGGGCRTRSGPAVPQQR